MKLWLLPGMHGTTEMFEPLLAALPSRFDVAPLGYPRDVALGYDALLERLVQPVEPFAIVAESFSGPSRSASRRSVPRGSARSCWSRPSRAVRSLPLASPRRSSCRAGSEAHRRPS